MIKKNRKLSVFILFTIVLIISLIFYFSVLKSQRQYYLAHHVKIHGVYLLKPLDIQNFSLTDTHDNPFTRENLKNHWTMVYFGFTNCEMICPTVMAKLNNMYTALQKTLVKNDLPQVIFITIDPERDSLKRIKDYVASFNQNFIGARGSKDSTIAIAKQFHITAKKTPRNSQNDNDYAVDHSPDVLLVNPEAKIQAYFPYPQQPTALAKDYQSILTKQARNQQNLK